MKTSRSVRWGDAQPFRPTRSLRSIQLPYRLDSYVLLSAGSAIQHSIGRAQIDRIGEPPASTQDTLLARHCRAVEPVAFSRLALVFVVVEAPAPDIADEVVEPECIRAEAAYRRMHDMSIVDRGEGCEPVVLAGRGVGGIGKVGRTVEPPRIIARWERRSAPPAKGVFVLRFRGEAQREPTQLSWRSSYGAPAANRGGSPDGRCANSQNPELGSGRKGKRPSCGVRRYPPNRSSFATASIAWIQRASASGPLSARASTACAAARRSVTNAMRASRPDVACKKLSSAASCLASAAVT